VPPCCCCCRGCAKPRPFSKRLFHIALRLVAQFNYVVPATTILGVWLELEKSSSTSDLTDLVELTLDFVHLASLMTAMYGLFIIFMALRPLARPQRGELKLLAIKLIVTVGSLQGLIIGLTVAKGGANNHEFFKVNYQQQFWKDWLLCVEALPFSFLLHKAYPAFELSNEPRSVNGSKAAGHSPGPNRSRSTTATPHSHADSESMPLLTDGGDVNYSLLPRGSDDGHESSSV
jgi:hypothetical protein